MDVSDLVRKISDLAKLRLDLMKSLLMALSVVSADLKRLASGERDVKSCCSTGLLLLQLLNIVSVLTLLVFV